MAELPRTLHKLLKKAGKDPDDLPDTATGCREALDLLSIEIEEIKSQLAGEAAGLTSITVQDSTWWNRANYALAMKKAEFAAIKRHRNHLLSIEEAERKRQKAEEQRQQQETADRRRAERQAAHVDRIISDAEVKMKAIQPLIRDLPPETRDAFYDAMSEAVARPVGD